MDQFSKERTAYPVAQLACIVNQLHRLALIMPEAQIPVRDDSLSALYTWLLVHYARRRRCLPARY